MINDNQHFLDWMAEASIMQDVAINKRGKGITIQDIKQRYSLYCGTELTSRTVFNTLKLAGYPMCGRGLLSWVGAVWKKDMPMFEPMSEIKKQVSYRIMIKKSGDRVRPGVFGSAEELPELQKICQQLKQQLGIKARCWIEKAV